MPDDLKPGPVESSWDGWKKEDECGWGPFQTGEDDPFLPFCHLHDFTYLEHDTKEDGRTRTEVDRQFLDRMLLMATNRDSDWLKIKAYIYWGIARGIGWIPWMLK